MYVRWKAKPLEDFISRNGDCWHDGPGRQLLTAIVVESHRTERGPRQVTLLRITPSIRSCCLLDPIVRVRWWTAVAPVLEHGSTTIDLASLKRDLEKKIPTPTDDEETIFALWPKALASVPRNPRARIELLDRLRVQADELLRPGQRLWKEALKAWKLVERAAREDAGFSELLGLSLKTNRLANAAIAAARSATRARPDVADAWARQVDAWDSQVATWLADCVMPNAQRESARRREQQTREAGHAQADPWSAPVAHAHRATVNEMLAFLELSVPFEANDVKRAQRRAAAKYHPDQQGNAEMMTAANIVARRLLEELARWGSASPRYARP